MNVLMLSNMRPSAQQPFAGVFVLNQYAWLRAHGGLNRLRLFTMKRTFTSAAGSALKYAAAGIRFIPVLFQRYDVVHVHFFYPFILLALGYRLFHPRAKLVATFHGADVSQHIRSRAARRLYSWAARRTHCLIAVSHELAATVQGKLGVAPHRVLCAGIDEKLFYKMKDQPKAYDFIFAGAFSKRKGADLFAGAVERLGRTDVRFCAAGAGEFRGALAALQSRFALQLVDGPGQDDLRILFNRSRFLVVPSRHEPFGLVITEAMYCGTPVVASRNGGLVEQIADGVNGFFIEDLSVDGLAQAMARALALPGETYRALADGALASNKKYSLANVGAATAALYRELAGRPPHAA
jgi:glycosyltransferase involved in cell wall biosynthesis